MKFLGSRIPERMHSSRRDLQGAATLQETNEDTLTQEMP